MGTYCTPVKPAHADLAQLTRAIIPLRPLRRSESERLVTAMIEATPTTELVNILHRGSRGHPLLLRLAVDAHRAGGALRILDGIAYLPKADTPASPPRHHPALQRVRLLGPAAWGVAKALAVLRPLGRHTGQLLTDGLGMSPSDMHEALLRLSPYITKVRGGWRFRAPLLEECLREQLGPWERQELSKLAVVALWDGAATCSDPAYLPDRLVDAGPVVDTERAGAELLAAGCAAMGRDQYRARRWLRAAARFLPDRAERATALALHAVACGKSNAFSEAVTAADEVLHRWAGLVSEDLLQEIHLTRLTALAAARDVSSLQHIADHGSRVLMGGEGCRAVSKAMALSLTGRWNAAHRTLVRTDASWASADITTATYGELLRVETAVLAGDATDLNRLVEMPESLPLYRDPCRRPTILSHLARILVGLGETTRAEHLLARHGVDGDTVSDADSALTGLRSGRWSVALERATAAIDECALAGQPIAHTALLHQTSTTLATRGWLKRARGVIERGRADHSAVHHVLKLAEADIALLLGERGRARRLLEHGLTHAIRENLLFNTDDLWLRILLLCPRQSHTALAELERVAGQMGTGRACRNYLLGRALVYKEHEDRLVELVEDRGQPAEVAETLELIAIHTPSGSARLLREAYEVYGDLDALLPRARIRQIMAERSIAVPGRAATVEETERLLAVLVAQGLTNRELANSLQTTEKSIESRLTRLFQRAGYRSRVELAAAVMTGRYPVER